MHRVLTYRLVTCIFFFKQVQILAYAHARKTQKMLCFIQLAENYVLSVGNIFFSHSHASWPKNGSKRRIWSNMRFFFREKLADGLISLKVFIEFTWLHIRPHKVTAKKGRLEVWPNTDILPSLHGAWNVLFGSWFGPSVLFFPKRQNWVGMPRFTMWLRLLACKHLLTNNERRLLQSCGYLDNKNIKEHRVLDHDHSREDFNLCKTKKMYTPLRSQFIPPIGPGHE